MKYVRAHGQHRGTSHSADGGGAPTCENQSQFRLSWLVDDVVIRWCGLTDNRIVPIWFDRRR